MINFRNYPNMTRCIIPEGTQLTNTDFSNAFKGMRNLEEVTLPKGLSNLSSTFANCFNLKTVKFKDNALNITNMNLAFHQCYNLTTAVCGPNVTSMSGTYNGCTNLTVAVCGDKVTNMYQTYSNCTNLTTAVCGPNVTNMEYAYYHCTNLTTAVCGPNVTDMYSTYSNCISIQGNAYFYSTSITTARGCFVNRSVSNMLNVYVPEKSTTLTTMLCNGRYNSVTEQAMTWTNDTTNKRYYNTTYNIYIYPVANVEETRIANGDPNNMGVI